MTPMTETTGASSETQKRENDAAYQVLARKYRPQRFADLIGHETMVRTLKNAFASNRIAHAYILTGVRGVGKTTTARILARALNYASADNPDAGPQMDMDEEGLHCRAIAESRHPDVLEMDAASRTGVGDIRELIEGVRYAPIEARFKVYIIDEVHMLSTAAFNALLKTLEEPPPHVKFIFATTEVRKLPVTVLSRCQRFDLRRIDPDTLCDHLAAIAEKEDVKISREGLWMIARAAEGSVRDALSILDQAIVQHAAQGSDGEVEAETIRGMLGLADRTGVWNLLSSSLQGEAKDVLEEFRAQYDAGAEPAAILRDMLDLVHLLTRIKAAGPEAAGHGPAGEADAERARAMAEQFEMNGLTRAWSLLMKGLSETQIAPDPAAAGEMALIRICFAADLPTPDEALKALKKNSSVGVKGAPTQARSAPQANTPATQAPPSNNVASLAAAREQRASVNRGAAAQETIQSFKDVVALAGKKRDAKLRTELESYVHLVSFAPGKIEFSLHGDAPPDLANRLALRLKEWTSKPWVISVSAEKNGDQTIRDTRREEVLAHPMVAKTLETFPGAEVTLIREPEIAAPAPDENEDERPEDPDLESALSDEATVGQTGKKPN